MAAANPKEELAAAKEHFDTTLTYPTISVDIDVRRLRFKCKTAFHTEDLVFTMNFHHREGTGGGGLLMGSLISVYQSVKTLVTRLHHWFDDLLRRYIFFSASMDGLVSDIFSGARDIQNETPKVTASAILKPNYGVLTSNTLVKLQNANFEIKATVLSFRHSEKYAQKRAKMALPQRPLPKGRIGSYGGKEKTST